MDAMYRIVKGNELALAECRLSKRAGENVNTTEILGERCKLHEVSDNGLLRLRTSRGLLWFNAGAVAIVDDDV